MPAGMRSVRRQEEEDYFGPCSFSGITTSVFAQLNVYRDRPAPTCAFLLALVLWGAGIYRLLWPELGDQGNVCLPPGALVQFRASEWRRYLLHPLWPFEAGYLRAFVVSSVLMLEGYNLEYQVGTGAFAGMLLGLHAAAGAVLLHYRLAGCLVSLEPALVALAAVMHRENPTIHTAGLDKGIRCPWSIEPRWHVWCLLAIVLLMAEDFPSALASHAVGLAAGLLCALREPEVWIAGWRVVRTRPFGLGATIHLGLMFFAMFFMPLTASALPDQLFAPLADGRALSLAWWKTNVPGSQPLFGLALGGALPGEMLYICKLLLACAPGLLLSPFRMWIRVYSVFCLLLAMYSMQSPVWRYPHVGFCAFLYLVWAFWTMPNTPERSLKSD